jgi:large subunit ribosomal protein L28
MAMECMFCGKSPRVGNKISHSNIKTKRRFEPNLQNSRHQLDSGQVLKVRVCTRCLRNGYVRKPLARREQASA